MKKLTKAEEQIMQALWSIDKGFAKDVLANIEGKKPAYNTALTVLRILVDKGFVKYETFGKSNRYEPVYSRDEYSAFILNNIQKNYFQNSFKNLVSFMVKEENVNLEELDDLLNELKRKK